MKSETHHQHHKSKVTVATLMIAFGIIYGDIGTSPLYVLKAVVGNHPISDLLVYGSVSCIIWTITFLTTIKYIILTLRADNNGEGGIFSLYALVRKYGKYLIFPTMIGASTLLADGIITPPISVSSAIEGLTIIKGLENLPTLPIVITIISILFFFQRYGTHRIGTAFGPIMTLWFIMLATLGVIQVIQVPEILKALNPWYAIKFVTTYPHGFVLLGGVFLATTGAEALYSDLGHCGRQNVRITWIGVKTALVLNYMGQSAWLLKQGAGIALEGRNPFFEIMPNWFLLIGIVMATTAAIIASQAMITGSYTLINEAMNLNFWPRVRVNQPSDIKGQIYVPSVNIMLWIGCIFVVLFFKDSEHMEAAYGLAITVTMIITSYLLSFYLIYKLHWNKIFVILLIGSFLSLEITFFIANVNKLPDGGYITILISAFYIFIMYSVYYGRRITNRITKFVDLGNYSASLRELSKDLEIPKYATHLVYLTKAKHHHHVEQTIIKSIFAKKPKRADIYWFLHINFTEEPNTLSYSVKELVDDNVIKVNVNVGFKVQPRAELYFKKIIQELVSNKELSMHIRPDGSTKYNKEPDFKFIVFERFLSAENEFTLHDNLVLNSYFLLKKIGRSDEAAFGLDKNDVLIEHIPLMYQSKVKVDLERVK